MIVPGNVDAFWDQLDVRLQLGEVAAHPGDVLLVRDDRGLVVNRLLHVHLTVCERYQLAFGLGNVITNLANNFLAFLCINIGRKTVRSILHISN